MNWDSRTTLALVAALVVFVLAPAGATPATPVRPPAGETAAEGASNYALFGALRAAAPVWATTPGERLARRGLRLTSVAMPTAGSLRLDVRAKIIYRGRLRLVSTGRTTLAAGAGGSVVAKSTRPWRKLLAREDSFPANVTATFTAEDGRSFSASRTVRLGRR
jgi:hypothetical protein